MRRREKLHAESDKLSKKQWALALSILAHAAIYVVMRSIFRFYPCLSVRISFNSGVR